uniref:Uncharacterized protein n=1 Tax=Plectus sambesii TaxID=2011161 RepID=A0A914WRN0_9BILA
MDLFCDHSLLFLLLLLAKETIAYGKTTFECPDATYLSAFTSTRGPSRRFYHFDCTKFSNVQVTKENCTISATASTADGEDLYLSCGDKQYTAGIEIIEEDDSTSWTLLCCDSADFVVRTSECSTTAFLNDDDRDHFNFSSGLKIIRKWQSLIKSEKDGGTDRRWWLQICPVDIKAGNGNENSVEQQRRSIRGVPPEWSAGRFEALRGGMPIHTLSTARSINPHAPAFEYPPILAGHAGIQPPQLPNAAHWLALELKVVHFV